MKFSFYKSRNVNATEETFNELKMDKLYLPVWTWLQKLATLQEATSSTKQADLINIFLLKINFTSVGVHFNVCEWVIYTNFTLALTAFALLVLASKLS